MSSRGRQSGRTRILVVEDDPELREFLEYLLTSEGYAVTTAQDGQAAIDMLDAQRFDLVLSDVEMPFASGIEVLEAARSRAHACGVILMTGLDDRALAARAPQARLVLRKPFTLEDLRRMLSFALGPPETDWREWRAPRR